MMVRLFALNYYSQAQVHLSIQPSVMNAPKDEHYFTRAICGGLASMSAEMATIPMDVRISSAHVMIFFFEDSPIYSSPLLYIHTWKKEEWVRVMEDMRT